MELRRSGIHGQLQHRPSQNRVAGARRKNTTTRRWAGLMSTRYMLAGVIRNQEERCTYDALRSTPPPGKPDLCVSTEKEIEKP